MQFLLSMTVPAACSAPEQTDSSLCQQSALVQCKEGKCRWLEERGRTGQSPTRRKAVEKHSPAVGDGPGE